jgi:hypothetical protein
MSLCAEERLEAIALPTGDFMRQELILECLLEALDGLAASASIMPQYSFPLATVNDDSTLA